MIFHAREKKEKGGPAQAVRDAQPITSLDKYRSKGGKGEIVQVSQRG